MSAMKRTQRLITNARVVTSEAVVKGTVAIRDGTFVELQTGRSFAPEAED